MTDRKVTAAKSSEELGEQIVAVAIARDMVAFEALFREFGPRIRAYLLKLTRDGQAAEDLMQETMLAIWRKAGQFDPARGQASAWLVTIARNSWGGAWRKRARPAGGPEGPAGAPGTAATAETRPRRGCCTSTVVRSRG